MKRGKEVMSVDEFRERYGDRRRSKYGVTADVACRSIGGHVYASRAEMRYAELLYVRLMALELLMVVEQPRVALGVPENIYVPDFLVMDQRRAHWFVDVKGAETSKWRRDAKLWASYGPARLDVVDAGTLQVRHSIPAGRSAQMPLRMDSVVRTAPGRRIL